MKRMITAIVAMFLWCGAAFTHDGDHSGPQTAQVLIEVHKVTAKGRDVRVSLRLTSLNGTVNLTSVAVKGATTSTFAPVAVPFAKDTFVTSILRFDTAPPAIFTAVLDFGVAGQGPVTIVPEY